MTPALRVAVLATLLLPLAAPGRAGEPKRAPRKAASSVVVQPASRIATTPLGDEGYTRALEALRADLNAQLFSPARLSASRHLVLEATENYLQLNLIARNSWLSRTCALWKKALEDNDVAEELPGFTVLWPAGGQLWHCTGQDEAGSEKIGAVESWRDDYLRISGPAARGGLFGYIGGQAVVNGPVDSNGYNLRLGSTLYQGRYDAALSYGKSTVATTPSYALSSYGLVGRALFPLDESKGWNLGLQFTRTVSTAGGINTRTDSTGVLGGLNFFLPGGSFDVTVTVGNNSTFGVQLGYTVYLTRT